MKLKELAQVVGIKLSGIFPDKLMYVDKITAESDGCFLLNITNTGGDCGISARKSRSVSFDLLYFSRSDENLEFIEWADIMQDSFKEIDVNGQIIHTRNRSAHCEDMVFHFLFSVEAAYIEYEPGEPMERLEAGIENGT